MKRLIDDCDVDSRNRRLVELVRAVSRLEPDPVRKQRILVQLRDAQRPRRPRLRATAAAIFLVSGSATAATVGHFAVQAHWLPQSSVLLAAQPTVRPAASAAPKARGMIEHDVPTAAPEPMPAVVPPIREPLHQSSDSSPVPMARSEQLHSVPRTGTSAAVWPNIAVRASDAETPSVARVVEDGANARPAPSGSATGSAHVDDREDAYQVVEAISALRSKGDGARSGVLLAEYLSAHPHGILAEDALALSIEAAATRHDPLSAAELGRRYLKQFPMGRFSAVALRASKLDQR